MTASKESGSQDAKINSRGSVLYFKTRLYMVECYVRVYMNFLFKDLQIKPELGLNFS